MLHNESREFLVKMYQRTYDAEETAKTFEISQRQVYRIVRQYRENGSVEVRTSQRGRKLKLSQEKIEQVNATLQKQPDITLGELIEQLHLNISQSRLGRIVRGKLGYSYKKSDPRFRTGASPMCRKSGKHGKNKWKRFQWKNLFSWMNAE